MSNETLEQRKARAFDWLVSHRAEIAPCGDDNWGVRVDGPNGGDMVLVGHGNTLLEAVEDAMSKEAKGL